MAYLKNSSPIPNLYDKRLYNYLSSWQLLRSQYPTMNLLSQNFSKSLRFLSLKHSMSSSSPAAFRTSPMEEGLSLDYDPGKYYPARIGETIGKYRVISKLGWGSNSTAWLAKDTSR